ncbi:TetR/AcrR family transcriptional repressor of mexJK operon [Paenibacillus sp. SORGH_AS306]|uniref:TetR/AcrR family transcriptional regulator n=1 Tax=unclassified Paenibacillus TaxID=185978 RepID=UPI002784D97B|nr:MULTISPECIES: TetR/AcrR family transcriptional regulator [unclassified Paenibacillus]MDQ1233637.1 TetR/AcrR family transcriptional repressor of mexJK operon [Paenibacillus sp. SORGH_AS_0306]MDR6110679.1 TetR/AcrR family transcriptional repressor of mexJK operon [Paenibacillus sp. SORGH_AS_0338]
MNTIENKKIRKGSLDKRAKIIAAARELFLSEGFNQSSVDAVANRAGVSKRTVYDYYGDKQHLLLAVMEETSVTVLNMIEQGISDHLLEFNDLEQALILFCEQIVASANGSSDYKALIRLAMVEVANLPESFYENMDQATEESIIKRFIEFGKNKLLDIPDPRMAVKHFVALTILLVFNQPKPEALDQEQVKHIITEGVRVFLRAYAPTI